MGTKLEWEKESYTLSINYETTAKDPPTRLN